jgi:hypothetical protein
MKSTAREASLLDQKTRYCDETKRLRFEDVIGGARRPSISQSKGRFRKGLALSNSWILERL